MTTIAAIVLAGGRSARFGRDKLREPIDGRPLLEHAIAAVRLAADEVVVIVGVDDTPPLPGGVRIVHDERPFEGPLSALALGLHASTAEIAIVVGGDMPSMVPAVLDRLTAALQGSTADAAVLDAGDDRPPMPMAVRRAVAAERTDELLAAGERRLRALPEVLHAIAIPERVWREDDPTGGSLIDVDAPADLP